VLYTGNGTAIGSGGNAITGVGFQPDWVWIKERSGAASHGLYDVVRGVTEQLESDTTAAETTESEGLTAFGSDGFTVGSLAQVNTNTDTYVAWNWKAGGTGVSNTDGTITSTVSANTDAGFSIVTYTGSAGGTVGHGLTQDPELIIVKSRTVAGQNWVVYEESLGQDKYLLLNTTAGVGTYTNYWGDGPVTDPVFVVGPIAELANNNGDCVAYCFHSVDGFSKVGSYTGNGSTDGPFVYTGFRPAWIMTKATSTTGDWRVWDNERNGDAGAGNNVVIRPIAPNLSSAENTQTDSVVGVDFTSNGFKFRSTGSFHNGSGVSFIFLAFAEQPFKYSNAR